MGVGCGDRAAVYSGLELLYNVNDDVAAGAAIEREASYAADESECTRSGPAGNKVIAPIATGIYAGLGVAACAGAAAGLYAYASMWPDSRLFGTGLTAPERPGELALTFDDGPSATWTPKLLDILASHNVRATFFLLGERAKV